LGIFGLSLVVSTLVANLGADWWASFISRRLDRTANWILAMRLFPFGFSALLTLGFALPAFLWLEPRRTAEAPDLYLTGGACFALSALAVVVIRCVKAASATNAVSRKWMHASTELAPISGLPIFRVETKDALFAVIGFLHPKVFVGHEALALLGAEEVEAAVAHELAHVRSFDNFKRAILSATRPPRCFHRLNSLDHAWSEAAESAADATASEQTSEVALASAIVKICRLQAPAVPKHPAIAISHLVKQAQSSAMAYRIANMRSLLKSDPYAAKHRRWSPRLLLLGAALAYVILLPATLSLTHRLMESFVK
jgi:Zn-dependent protease with chaperone function